MITGKLKTIAVSAFLIGSLAGPTNFARADSLDLADKIAIIQQASDKVLSSGLEPYVVRTADGLGYVRNFAKDAELERNFLFDKANNILYDTTITSSKSGAEHNPWIEAVLMLASRGNDFISIHNHPKEEVPSVDCNPQHQADKSLIGKCEEFYSAMGKFLRFGSALPSPGESTKPDADMPSYFFMQRIIDDSKVQRYKKINLEYMIISPNIELTLSLGTVRNSEEAQSAIDLYKDFYGTMRAILKSGKTQVNFYNQLMDSGLPSDKIHEGLNKLHEDLLPFFDIPNLIPHLVNDSRGYIKSMSIKYAE